MEQEDLVIEIQKTRNSLSIRIRKGKLNSEDGLKKTDKKHIFSSAKAKQMENNSKLSLKFMIPILIGHP